MQRQNPCDRNAVYAALDFAIPSPPTPDCGGIHSSFNAHLTAQPALAEGSPPQVCLTGLQSGEVDLWFADTGLSPFSVVPQLGIAFPGSAGRSLARCVPRRTYSLNPARSLSHFQQAHLRLFLHLPKTVTARQLLPLAVDRCFCDAEINRNLDEQLLRRWARNRASPSVRNRRGAL